MLEHSHIRVDDVTIHLVEGGRRDGPPILFLHGWPQCAAAFERVMHALADDARVLAIDLPGIGRSETALRSNDKRSLASHVHRLLTAIDARDVTLVGHDVGGMIVYAYLRSYPGELARAAILSVAIPGVTPWSETTHNPHVWHFGFHAVPNLPERLVRGHEAEYFAFFFDAIAASPDGVSKSSRAVYAAAYQREEALHTGFEWYRAFAQDEKDNAEWHGKTSTTPVLYARGECEQGELAKYVSGLREAGLRNVRGESIRQSGHFSPDEQPEYVADALRRFLR